MTREKYNAVSLGRARTAGRRLGGVACGSVGASVRGAELVVRCGCECVKVGK